MKRISHFVIRWRWFVIVGFLGVSAYFGSRIPDAEVESQMKEMLPLDMASRISLDKIESIFGGTEMVMVVVEAPDVLDPAVLERVEELSKRMEGVKVVDRVLSLFTLKEIRGADQDIYVDPAVNRIPKSDKKRERLRKRLEDNNLVYGSVVSKDFTATTIIALLKADANDNETMESVNKVVDEVQGPGTIHIAGMPITRIAVAKGIRGDMKRFLPFGLLIMLIFLFACFRQLRGVLLPFGVVVLAILFSMGLVAVLGWKIHIVTILLPVILLAVANDYGIHLIARYQEVNTPGNTLTSKELARDLIEDLGTPVIVAGLTTVVGLGCLATHIAIPAKQLGFLAGAGVLFALFASLGFIPAVISLLPKAKPAKAVSEGTGGGHLLDRGLHAVAQWVVRRPKLTVVSFVSVTLLVGIGAVKVNVDTNPVHYYPPENELVVASTLVDKEFGGSTPISIMATGDVKSPQVLRDIDEMETKLKALPMVGETSSVAEMVKEMNQAFNNGDEAFETIPETRGEIAELFFLYEMSGDPEDFERMVDMPYENALLTARVNSAGTKDVASVVDFIEDEIAKDPDTSLNTVGGFGPMLSELADAIVRGQALSLLFSMLLVGLLVGLVFRSVASGFLASVPLGLSILLLFGIMGWFQFDLNIATVMLSSIMIGVGVDYTIHFLWRYRKERALGLLPEEAVVTTLTTTGRGIVFNALSVIVGFAILMVSSFLPVQFFGLLVMISIGTCLLGALVLLPALALWIRPRFLEPKEVKTEING